MRYASVAGVRMYCLDKFATNRLTDDVVQTLQEDTEDAEADEYTSGCWDHLVNG